MARRLCWRQRVRQTLPLQQCVRPHCPSWLLRDTATSLHPERRKHLDRWRVWLFTEHKVKTHHTIRSDTRNEGVSCGERDCTDACSLECRWTTETVRPAEWPQPWSVWPLNSESAFLHRLEQLLSVHEGVKEVGEQVEGERRRRSKFTDKVPFGIPVLLHAWGERTCWRDSPTTTTLTAPSVLTPAPAPTDHLIQTDDTDAGKWHRNTTDCPAVRLTLAETDVLMKQLKEVSTKADAPSTGCENNREGETTRHQIVWLAPFGQNPTHISFGLKAVSCTLGSAAH